MNVRILSCPRIWWDNAQLMTVTIAKSELCCKQNYLSYFTWLEILMTQIVMEHDIKTLSFFLSNDGG